jgi:hypothetical protein
VSTIIILAVIPIYGESGVPLSPITILSPAEGEVVIGKKPPLRFQLGSSLKETPIFVMLDGSDITQMTTRTDEFIEYQPITVLNSGQHAVTVVYLSAEGQEERQEFTFSLRHTELFEEATTNLALSPIYEGVIDKTDNLSIPNSKIQANLGLSTGVKEGNWRTSFESNFRYLDQSLPVAAPQSKGIDLANYRLKADYTSEETNINAEVGDIIIDESPTTVSGLGRRGAKVNYQTGDITVGAFMANSSQVSGFNGGTGLENTSEDHIYGISLAKNFSEYNTFVKTLYITGGQNSDGNSTANTIMSTPRKGDTLAFIFGSKLFEDTLGIDGEFDLSRYDADTTDNYGKEVDRAYKLRVGGMNGQFAYDALYEYLGTNYRVIDNDGLQRDKEGVTLQGRYFESVHSVDVSLSTYTNNVDNDPLFATIRTNRGSIGYQYSGISTLPLSLRYEKSTLRSKDEPTPDAFLDTSTDAVSLSANYLNDSWNIGTTAKYSRQDDQSNFNNDSKIVTYMITPSYFIEDFSITPGFMFNRATSPLTTTDTSSASLQLFGNETLFQQKFTYALSGIYTKTKNDIGSYNQESLSSEARIAYIFEHNQSWLSDPSVGLRGLYTKQTDHILDQCTETGALLFFVSLPVNYTF